MACTLSFSQGDEDFTATTGASFTLDMTGPPGTGLVIVSMSYNKTTVTAAPFTFTVAAGSKYCFIHFEALKPGAKLKVVETCGGSASQTLETLFFDPANPGTGYTITGK